MDLLCLLLWCDSYPRLPYELPAPDLHRCLCQKPRLPRAPDFPSGEVAGCPGCLCLGLWGTEAESFLRKVRQYGACCYLPLSSDGRGVYLTLLTVHLRVPHPRQRPQQRLMSLFFCFTP